jgi:hypothetical protein
MSHTPRYADQVRCPACRSHRIACVVGQIYDFCLKCAKVWERIPAGEHYLTDGEMLAFHLPCDNCAFRGSSPERADRARWRELEASLSLDHPFYCHKGVPCDPVHAHPEGAFEFQFPMRRSAVDLAGACRPFKTWDTAHMRLCRGYLNQYVRSQMAGP